MRMFVRCLLFQREVYLSRRLGLVRAGVTRQQVVLVSPNAQPHIKPIFFGETNVRPLTAQQNLRVRVPALNCRSPTPCRAARERRG